MHVEEKVTGEVAILSLRGELVDDEGDSVLSQKVNSLTVDGISKFIIDLGKVNRINSRGLSALISAVKKIRATGGDIRLAQIDKNMNEEKKCLTRMINERIDAEKLTCKPLYKTCKPLYIIQKNAAGETIGVVKKPKHYRGGAAGFTW